MKPTGKPHYRFDWGKGAWLITDWRWITSQFKPTYKVRA